MCYFCGHIARTHKSCSIHMGMVMNRPASCTWFDKKLPYVDYGNKVPCVFCEPFGSKLCNGFVALGAHVIRDHAAEISAASLKLPDKQPDKYDEAVDALGPDMARDVSTVSETGWFLEEELPEMLPQPGGGKTPSQRTGTQQSKPKTGLQFIGVEDLTQDPQVAKILATLTENTGYNDLVLKISIGARRFFFGLKASNPNYETLFRAFGGDETKWVGLDFTIGLNFNEVYEEN